MTTAVATLETRPTALLKYMLETFWDEQDGALPTPTVREVPIERAARIEVEGNDHLLIYMEDRVEETIHIGYKNIDLTIPMRVVFEVSSSRQKMYDMAREVRRIIRTHQHDPAVYLLEGFENYDKDESQIEPRWARRDSTDNPSINYTNLVLHDDERPIATNPTYLRIRSNTAFPILRFRYTLPNFVRETDYGDMYYDFLPHVKYLSFYARHIDGGNNTKTLNVYLRKRDEDGNELKVGTSLTPFRITTEWQQYSFNLEEFLDDMYNNPTDEYYLDFNCAAYGMDLDYIVLGSCDYQFMRYINFREHPETFNYWRGEIRAEYRDVGAPIDSFSVV